MNTLTIAIDSGGVQRLAGADQQIVLVPAIRGAPQYLVAWVVQPPAQQTQVTWSATYAVYGSSSPLAYGAPITLSFQADATAGSTYDLTPAGFGPGQSTGGASYKILNSITDPASMIGGLAQQATVNDAEQQWSPISAYSMLSTEQATLDSTNGLLVFPAAGVSTATTVDPDWLPKEKPGVIVGVPLLLDFSSESTQTIQYDDVNNRFMSVNIGATTQDVRHDRSEHTS